MEIQRKSVRVCSLALVVCGMARSALSASITWDNGGGASKSWNTGANWSDNLPPSSGNTYTISVAGGENTTLDADFAIQKLIYSRGATGGLTGGTGAPHTLTLSNGAGGVVLDLHTAQTYTISNTVNLALGANSTIESYGGGNLVVDGVLSGSGYSLTKTDEGRLTLNGSNTYSGPTTISAGVLAANGDSALGGSGQNVAINVSGVTGSALGYTGMALTQSLLTDRVTPSSAGTIAMGANTANDLDFTGLSTRLGAVANATYTGTLTPNGSSYLVGGGGATLTFPNANTFVDGAGARSLDINLTGGRNSTVAISAANSFSGGTLFVGPGRGTGSQVLDLRSNGALGTGPVTLKGGTLAFSTTPQVFSNDIALVTGGVLATGEIYANNVPVVLAGALDLGAGTTLEVNQVYSGNHLVILTQPTAGSGKLIIVRGVMAISNANQLPAGNVDRLTYGNLLLDGVTWQQFAANRAGGYGTGADQWQASSSTHGWSARGTPLVISTNGIPGFNPATYADAGGAKVYSYCDKGLYLGNALTKDGAVYANAPVTIAVDTVLSGRRGWLPADTGPGLYGAHADGIVYTITGNVSDQVALSLGPSRGCFATFANAKGELVFAGTNDWTGSAFVDNIGTPLRSFGTGPGGMTFSRQSGDDVFVRFDGAHSLPRGNGGNTAYLSQVGPSTSGYLLTAKPEGEAYELPTGMLFVLGHIPGGNGKGVLGSSGLPGSSATLRSTDVAAHCAKNSDMASLAAILLPVRGGILQLGETGSPVSFFPTFGMQADALDPGIAAAATPIYDANLVTGRLTKVNTGTLILGNVAYTDLAKSADKAGKFAWQMGRGTANNRGTTSYFDGAVQGLADGDPLASNANSLAAFLVELRGGVYESNGRGAVRAFTRALGGATSDVKWGIGGGGFAAHDGPLDVNIGGAADSLTWGLTANFVVNNDPLVFGSETADDRVTFANPVALNSALREVRVIDNPAANGDRATLAGALTGTGSSGLLKGGEGVLELATTNTYAGTTQVTNGTLLVNGSLNAQSSTVTVHAGAALGGTGTVSRAVSVVSGGGLTPGDLGSVGTLTVATNLTFATGAVYDWQFGGGAADRVVVGGTLALPAYATVNVSALGGSLPTPSVLFHANAITISGADDLSGWTLNGLGSSYQLAVVGDEVRLRASFTTILVR